MKSFTGLCVFFYDSLSSWKAKKLFPDHLRRQSIKHYSHYKLVSMDTSISSWFTDFSSISSLIFCDNQAEVRIASNPIFHEQMKHIKINCYFIHDKFVDVFVKLLQVRSQHQLADIFTKPLPGSLYYRRWPSSISIVHLERTVLECISCNSQLAQLQLEEWGEKVEVTALVDCKVVEHFISTIWFENWSFKP